MFKIIIEKHSLNFGFISGIQIHHYLQGRVKKCFAGCFGLDNKPNRQLYISKRGEYTPPYFKKGGNVKTIN